MMKKIGIEEKKIRYLWTQKHAIFINTYDLDARVSHALFM